MPRKPHELMAPYTDGASQVRPLPARALPFIWLALLATTLCVVGVFVAAAPLRYGRLAQGCGDTPACRATAAYLVALDGFTALVWLALAALVLWRRPGDRIGVFTALTLLTFGVGRFPDTPLALSAAYPAWTFPVEGLRFLGSACLSIFVFVFPDGVFVPRFSRWIAAGWILIQIPEFFFPTTAVSANSLPPALQFVGFLGFVSAVIATQTWRYTHVATFRQRQQTRWVIFGLALALVCYLALAFGYPFVAAQTRTAGPLGPVARTSLISLTFLLVPVSLAIAILRHRLFDIDLLINRALVYGALTAALSALYFALVVALQVIVVAVTNARQISPLAIVCSTLAVASVFQPLRRAIQRGIDHRFYRRKYDATATVAAFAASLRQGMDLAELREQLIEAAHETMQPTHASLWLQAPAPRQREAPR